MKWYKNLKSRFAKAFGIREKQRNRVNVQQNDNNKSLVSLDDYPKELNPFEIDETESCIVQYSNSDNTSELEVIAEVHYPDQLNPFSDHYSQSNFVEYPVELNPFEVDKDEKITENHASNSEEKEKNAYPDILNPFSGDYKHKILDEYSWQLNPFENDETESCIVQYSNDKNSSELEGNSKVQYEDEKITENHAADSEEKEKHPDILNPFSGDYKDKILLDEYPSQLNPFEYNEDVSFGNHLNVSSYTENRKKESNNITVNQSQMTLKHQLEKVTIRRFPQTSSRQIKKYLSDSEVSSKVSKASVAASFLQYSHSAHDFFIKSMEQDSIDIIDQSYSQTRKIKRRAPQPPVLNITLNEVPRKKKRRAPQPPTSSQPQQTIKRKVKRRAPQPPVAITPHQVIKKKMKRKAPLPPIQITPQVSKNSRMMQFKDIFRRIFKH